MENKETKTDYWPIRDSVPIESQCRWCANILEMRCSFQMKKKQVNGRVVIVACQGYKNFLEVEDNKLKG